MPAESQPGTPPEPRPGERPASAPLLRGYLAGRDVPCEGCGYNLRGVTDVFCPECGAVIPRPPVDAVERMRTSPADLKLYCRRCGCSVTGHDPGRCPECGQAALARYTGESPPRIHRSRLPRGLPAPLAVLGALGLVTSLTALALGLARSAGSTVAAGFVGRPVLSAALAAIPVALAGGWLLFGRGLRNLGPGERKALSLLAGLAAGVSLFAALWVLR